MKNFDFNNKLYVITESGISKGRSNEEVVEGSYKRRCRDNTVKGKKNRDKEQIKEEAVKTVKNLVKRIMFFLL